MKNLLLVGIGGFIGASLRYFVTLFVSPYNRYSFPLNAFIINFVGCVLLGVFVGLKIETWLGFPLQEFLVIGVLGGFTTFSAFSMESFQMLTLGHIGLLIVYVFSSVLMGLAGISIGLILSK